ncbi:hypothetical protein [Roseobacter sp.]|uniref:hypothetical protein n=1 Tax=Roseobacter sp. TaxID=1907202 RepID=UPI003297050E
MREPQSPGRVIRPSPTLSDRQSLQDRLLADVQSVLTRPGAPADIRDRLGDILDAGDSLGTDRPIGPVTPDLSDPLRRLIAPEIVLEVADRFPELDLAKPKPGALKQTADLFLGTLREIAPEALPTKPLAAGLAGAALPLPDKLSGAFVRQAAADVADAAERVLWDDGVNQLLVEIGSIKTETAPRRVTLAIPVTCDQIRTTMRIPFATGGEGRVAGLVTAAPDRPLGDALIAQIWGDALISLAHSSLLAVADALAAASGRDARNDQLVPRALHAEKGVLRIETEARQQLKGVTR